jgi:hypothetical protein
MVGAIESMRHSGNCVVSKDVEASIRSARAEEIVETSFESTGWSEARPDDSRCDACKGVRKRWNQRRVIMNLASMSMPRERSAAKFGADAKRQKYQEGGPESGTRDEGEARMRCRDVTNVSGSERESAARSIADQDLRGGGRAEILMSGVIPMALVSFSLFRM